MQICKHGLIRLPRIALRKRRGRSPRRYSAATMTVAQKQALDAGVGSRVRWVSDGNAVEKFRAVKDATELSSMREAAGLISAVFHANSS